MATGDDACERQSGVARDWRELCAGKVGRAFNFDGVNARVSVGANPHLDLAKSSNAGFSVEFWMNPNSSLNGGVSWGGRMAFGLNASTVERYRRYAAFLCHRNEQRPICGFGADLVQSRVA